MIYDRVIPLELRFLTFVRLELHMQVLEIQVEFRFVHGLLIFDRVTYIPLELRKKNPKISVFAL
jgi:hypothetical protein